MRAKQKFGNAYSWAWKNAAMAYQVLPEGTWRKSRLSDKFGRIFSKAVTNKWWNALKRWKMHKHRHGSMKTCCNGSSSTSRRHLKEILIIWQLLGNFSMAVTNNWWRQKKVGIAHGFIINLFWRQNSLQNSLFQVVQRFFIDIPNIFAIFTCFIATKKLLN